jgi:hypothetical protein
LERALKTLQGEGNEDLWSNKFVDSIVLKPSINPDGTVGEISAIDAFSHFISITWLVVFCLIPPKNYNRGFSSFGVSLLFIGLLTAIVG